MADYGSLKNKLIANGRITKEEALEFFHLLFEESTKKAKELCGTSFTEHFPTKQYTKNGWKFKVPLGVCDHFTADISIASTLRWFSSKQWKQPDGTFKHAGASSAFVIDLDGTIYCLIDFWNGNADWHEPQLNGYAVGIEHVNAGELRLKDGEYYMWPNSWGKIYPYKDVIPPLQLDWRGAKFMMPYTREQVISNLIIKCAFLSLYPETSRPEWFVDHATYRDDKKDMGPHWPLAALRSAAFSGKPLDSFVFMHQFTPAKHVRDNLNLDALDFDDLNLFEDVSVDFHANHHQFVRENDKIIWTQLALSKLGYKVGTTGRLDAKTINAIKNFQAGNNLKVDGIPGPETRKKLAGSPI